ncbi:MAG: hypothetical protein HGA65_20290, partial [Oscillochloris sp.]|nr:hypothetical protein [Oscillochloris sp.]
EDLASAIDRLGMAQAEDAQQPTDQGQFGGAGNGSLPGEQRTQPAQRLGVDGVPLGLEAQGDGSSSSDGAVDAGATQTSGGFTQGGSTPSTDPVQVADDPLRIPADLRDVVQDYFSP